MPIMAMAELSRAETESDSGFMDSNQIPVFQGIGIDSDQFLGILEMIRQGFTQIFSDLWGFVEFLQKKFEVLLNCNNILWGFVERFAKNPTQEFGIGNRWGFFHFWKWFEIDLSLKKMTWSQP